MSEIQVQRQKGFQRSEVALIISSRSRQGHEWGESFDLEARRAFAYFRLIDGSDSWAEAVKKAVSAGAKAVAIAGGDGSLRLSAPAVIDSGLVLGVIPTGTGNALARELGINLSPDAALDHLFEEGHVEAIDVGTMNGEIFLTVATLGLTGAIQKEVSRLPKAELGISVYVPALFRALSTAHPFYIEVEAGEKSFEGAVHQCVVGVGSKHGGFFSLAPHATRTDGVFHIYVATATGLGGLGAYVLQLATQALGDSGAVWTASSTEVSIKVNRKRSFILDGDAYKWDKATGKVMPGALKVWVPG